MSLISRRANRTLLLERKTGEDTQYHETTYADPESIRAVTFPAYGTLTTNSGASTQAETRIVTETEVALADLIDGMRVKRVVPRILLDKTSVIYEVYL